MTDIREEFARIAESRRKPPISGSNIGYNCAIDEMVAELRALPSVCGGEDEFRQAAVDLVEQALFTGLDAPDEYRYMLDILVKEYHADRLRAKASNANAPSPPPVSAREESIRNAIAAMEELVAETAEHLRNIVEAKTEDFRGLDDPRLRSAYEQETARMEAIVQRGRASLAALKREVG